jgi:hypothetical protein
MDGVNRAETGSVILDQFFSKFDEIVPFQNIGVLL